MDSRTMLHLTKNDHILPLVSSVKTKKLVKIITKNKRVESMYSDSLEKQLTSYQLPVYSGGIDLYAGVISKAFESRFAFNIHHGYSRVYFYHHHRHLLCTKIEASYDNYSAFPGIIDGPMMVLEMQRDCNGSTNNSVYSCVMEDINTYRG